MFKFFTGVIQSQKKFPMFGLSIVGLYIGKFCHLGLTIQDGNMLFGLIFIFMANINKILLITINLF